MESLLSLLNEAALTPDIIDKMIKQGTRVSIYYKGDDKNKKGWRQVGVIKSEKRKDKEGKEVEYLIVKDWGSEKEEEIPLILDLITNWNILSKVKVDIDNEIKDAIKNKRVVTIKYKGELESSVGVRIPIMPVAYGIRNGRKYIRAWQGGGKTVRGEYDKNNSQYRPMPGWRLFRLDRLSGWEVTTAPPIDNPPGGNYNTSGDKWMQKVIVQSIFEIEKPKKKKQKTKKKKSISEGHVLNGILDAVRVL